MFAQQSTDDRGQVGIGTLIVFIAMVLVAAIAAGVLINTAGFLQTQAEATGEESTAQVSDNIQVVNEVGFTNETSFEQTDWAESGGPDEDNKVQRVELTLQKAAGSGDIDLSHATIEYLGDTATTLTHEGVDFGNGDIDSADLNETNSSFFATDEVRGTSGSDVLIDDDDRSAIVIPLGDYEMGDNGNGDQDAGWLSESDASQGDVLEQPEFLEPGDSVDLTITTAQGSQVAVSLNAPDIISDDPAVDL